MRGIYVLLLKLKKPAAVKVGKIGIIDFKKGYYAYAGSALNCIEARIKRHLRKQKKIHWHIDYLLQEPAAKVERVYALETKEHLECSAAQALASAFNSIPHFGATDCKCPSHLFDVDPQKLEELLKKRGFRTF
jgi:Uri superfamily endonuclease